MSPLFDSIAFDEAPFDAESSSVSADAGDSIVFNGYGLQNATIISSQADPDSGPSRDLVRSDRPRGDGRKIQSDSMREKTITIVGVMRKATGPELETELDLMKKRLHKQGGRLEITQGGQKRVYEATVSNFDQIFSGRVGSDISRCPFSIQFACVSAFGFSESRAVNSFFGVTAASSSFEILNEGTYKAKPIFSIFFDAASSVSKVHLKNNTTGKEIEILASFVAGDRLEVDGEAMRVTKNGAEIDFDGFFWDIETDRNSVTLTITSSSHSVTLTEKHYLTYL